MAASPPLSEKLFSLLQEKLQDYATFVVDTQGQILSWTPGVQQLLGYEEAEFIGQTTESLFLPEDQQCGVPKLEMEEARTRGRADVVRWCRRNDGTRVWVEGHLLSLRNEAGQLEGFVQILRDDTAHKLLEDKLREVTERFQSALDAGRIGTWQWNIQANRVFADVNLARFFGVSAKDAKGGPIEHYISAIHLEDKERVVNAIHESIASNKPFAEDYRLVHNDGALFWVEARGRIEKDSAGLPLRLDGVVLDITGRKEVEVALSQSEERYRTLFNSIDSGFCVVEILFDDDKRPINYRFLEVNPAFEVQTGLNDVSGKLMLDLAPQHERHWFEIYGRVALTGEPVKFENYAEALNRWFDVYALPAGEPASHKVAILFTDITDRKRAEDALRIAHEKSEEANRLKDEFLATLSHELRSPLNAIMGWANLLRNNELDEETRKSGLEVIERNSRAQAQLIEDLLDVSRILTGKLRLERKTVEIGRVLEEALLAATPAADTKQIELHREIEQTSTPMSGDPQRLAQIFTNVLSNAIKFTPYAGHIWVRMARVESQVRVQITDSGRGISPEFLPHVFERFRQADSSSTRSSGGLGIGLGLVKYLVESHGGSVEATSPGEGQGATFTLWFPLMSSSDHPASTALGAATAGETTQGIIPATVPENMMPPLKGLKILVVDDEPDSREIVAMILRQRGGSVEIANSAASAFHAITTAFESKQPFDALVSDVGMPDEDGYSLIRRIRLLNVPGATTLPAIALTAYAAPKDRVKALMAGFQNHIGKPVDAMELVAAVASLVGRTGNISRSEDHN